jgi:DNA topoisomerase-3
VSVRAGMSAQRERSPVYSIGRVQTPTLAIVVRREQSILAFRPRDYWEVRATFNLLDDAPSAAFAAMWETRGERGKGGITRFAQAGLAESVVERVRLAAGAPKRNGDAGGGGAVVERLREKRSREPAPQLFDLTSLQRTANRRFGLSATRTLEAAQSLYEKHKLLTYPRTDSRHLTLDLFDELPRLFRGAAQLPNYASYAQFLLATAPPRSKRIFDDTKVQDHHAIIPTGKGGSLETLSLDERRVFDLVMRRFLGAFYPDAEFALTAVVVRVGEAEPGAATPPGQPSAELSQDPAEVGFASNETMLQGLPPPPDRFFARGRVRLVAGWQEVAQLGGAPRPAAGRAEAPRAPDAEDGEAPSTLPILVEGQRLRGTFETVAKQTKPPPRHTEASLLGAMESAGRDIEDEALRAAMKDTGLGTPATRAATIETLVKRVFITRNGKQLVPTDMGMALIDTLPVASLASPELTGAWEARLARIARRQESRASFMLDIAQYVGEVVDSIRRARFDPRGGPVTRRPSSPPKTVGAAAGVATAAKVSPAVAAAARVVNEPAHRSEHPVAPSTTSALTLACPRCTEGMLVRGKRGWGCSRWKLGCPFVVWFETAGRKVTDVELRDLVQKGKTRKARWSPAGGPKISGRLVLDMTVAPPSGAGRFQPA